MPRPVTDADRAEILRRHAAGETRNAIARAVGRNGQTVSAVVHAAGGSFDRRGETRVATETRQLDLAARRAQLALDLQGDAERLRKQMWQPHRYWDWGGKDHEFDEMIAEEPTPADKRALMATVATAVDRSLKLEPIKDENGAEAIGSLLGGLLDGLRDRHGDG